MDYILDRKQKGTVNFQIKDGHFPNLNLPKELQKVYYTHHALDVMKLPSRGHHGEILSKFPVLCKSRTTLHPYDLKKQWWNLEHLNNPFPIGSHPDNWNEFYEEPDNFYEPLDWEYDLFPLDSMAIRSYKTVDDDPSGKVESALFTGEWSKKWYAIAIRLNYPKDVLLTTACSNLRGAARYFEAITMYPTSWKEATTDREYWNASKKTS